VVTATFVTHGPPTVFEPAEVDAALDSRCAGALESAAGSATD
jgi:hypothetical protein